MREIIDSIQKIAGHKDNVRLLAATVDSVDLSTRTCIVSTISEAATTVIENVMLMASVDDGMLIVPAIDSNVIVSYSTFNQPFICLFSAVDKIYFVAANLLQISAQQAQFNDGKNGGLINVIALTQKINALENAYNDLVNKFNSHTHVLALSAGTGTAAPTAAPETTLINPITARKDIEDTTVTH